MTFRAKIQGPSVRDSVFGADIFEVAGPTSVQDIDGVLIICTLPTPYAPAEGTRRARRGTRGSQVVYPRGGWSKVTVTDFIDEGGAR